MDSDHLFTDRDSFASRLIRRKAKLLVRHPAFDRSEREDVEQELVMEVLVKSRSYDPKRGRESTFIARVIESKAISLFRVRLAQKRDYRHAGQSLNESVRDPQGACIDLAETLDSSSARSHTGQTARSDEDLAQLRIDVAELFKALPGELRRLAELLMEMSEHAAGRALGQSRRQTAKGVARLRALFEDAGLRDFL